MTKAPTDARDPDLVAFGAQVRGARERAGLRIRDLAKDLEISEYHLGSIERGRDRASNAIYWRIANALDLDPSPVLRDGAA